MQKKPQDAVATQLLPEAYRHAQQQHEERVNAALRSNNQLKWEAVRSEYRTLQQLYNTIQKSPAALRIVQPKDYSTAITGAQENAAEVRYDRGIALLERGDKMSARKAYDEFVATLKLVPDYRDTKNLRDEAFERAVVRVVVGDIEVRSMYSDYRTNQFRDNLASNLQQRNNNRFVIFYDERTARNANLRPDEYIALRFADIMIGRTIVDETKKHLSKEIETSSYTDTTGRVIKTYTTVHGTISVIKKRVESSAILDYRITKLNGNHLEQVLREDRIPNSYTWTNEYGTFHGDDRALDLGDRSLIQGFDRLPPSPPEIFMAIVHPIYAKLEQDLQQFYNGHY
ncbi:hypothetical protein [Chitinophaga nivalis]|uniref:hypothetical protein n=1 Tax=Chitinophaga nivalis TaxID=2991709 RepID=UPI002228397B|nr:hypothetical protein [Chitinophaga nivalis]MCW3465374.1 hypothetical protein [Chitinophaga nivalis]